MKPITKAVIGVVSAALLAASLAGCAAKPVTEAEGITIDGVYVNNSYKDDENDKLKMLYVFYTVSAAEENLSLDNIDTIGIGENSYGSKIDYRGHCGWITSHEPIYNAAELYMGDTLKVVSLFEVPEHDLAEGKEITFLLGGALDDSVGDEDLLFFTDDIVFCKSAKEVGKLTNPEGFETMSRVCNSINGHKWQGSISGLDCEVKFVAPNRYKLTMLGETISGEYTVKDGNILCKSNLYKVDPLSIPYSWKDNTIRVHISKAFDD